MTLSCVLGLTSDLAGPAGFGPSQIFYGESPNDQCGRE